MRRPYARVGLGPSARALGTVWRTTERTCSRGRWSSSPARGAPGSPAWPGLWSGRRAAGGDGGERNARARARAVRDRRPRADVIVVDGVHPDRFNYADAALMERTPAGGIERLE